MTGGLAAVLLLAPASAGARQDGGRSLEWGLSDCRGVIGLIPVEAAAVRAHLPPGFAPVLPDSVAALLPPDPRLDAVLGLEVLDCARGVGLHGWLEELDYASFWTFVEPPARLRDHGQELAFFKWDTLVPDRDRRDLLRRYGLAARGGEVDLTLWSDDAVGGASADAGVAFEAGWSFSDGERYRFTGAAAAPVSFAGSFIEFTQASSGLAEWVTRYRSDRAVAGAGTVTLDPRGLPARMLGRISSDAYFLVPSGLDFFGSRIDLPPKPAAPLRPS